MFANSTSLPQAWIKPQSQLDVLKQQIRRGRFVRSARNAREEACARMSALVKDVLGPAWLRQALEVRTRMGLCFQRRTEQLRLRSRIAYLDALVGQDANPDYLVKISASCQPRKIAEGIEWLSTHRAIARREWPEIRALMLMVDTSSTARADVRFGNAVGTDFSFKLENLEPAFEADMIPVVVLRPRDLFNFGLIKRLVDPEQLEVVEKLGC